MQSNFKVSIVKYIQLFSNAFNSKVIYKPNYTETNDTRVGLLPVLEKNMFYLICFRLQLTRFYLMYSKNHSPGNYYVHQRGRNMVQIMIVNLSFFSFLICPINRGVFEHKTLFILRKVFLVILYKDKTIYCFTLFFFY